MPANGPVNFVALGDGRYNPKIWGLITNQNLKFELDFAVHTGDIVGNGNDYDIWDRDYATPAQKILTPRCFYLNTIS
jgi:hypothetical protein